MSRIAIGFALFFLLTLNQLTTAQSIYEPSVDQDVVEKIKEQGLHNSQIMNMASWLTDVYGPRLSNSPQLNRAHEWTQKQFQEMGLSNVHLHQYGPFGKGWELKRFALHANSPYAYFPVTAFPKAWSPGYDGPVRGEVIQIGLEEADDLEKYRGRLSDKFVMVEYLHEPEPGWDPIATRTSKERLLNLANATENLHPGEPTGPSPAAMERAMANYRLMSFLKEERPLAILDQSYRGWYGQIAIASAQLPNEPGTPWGERINPYMPDAPEAVPQISLAREHYGRIFRLLEKDKPVTLELELEVAFQDDDLYGYNSVAEIPGTDPDLMDEIVMLGAHIDSWHSATGATDNAAGSAVMMEVMRILKEIGIEPRRTIRVALWGNEEQGLHGSREYVADHFAEQVAASGGSAIETRDGYDNLSAYYNIDNGTGQVRGIYLQGNEQLRQIFRAWLSPFSDWDANTVSFANTSGTDHLSFDRVGLPGFQFIQDPIEYFTMTHHSNQDFYERLVEEDLQKTAIIVATFVYHTAMLDERLPRKGELDFPVTD